MIFNAQMIDILKQLRRKFKEQNIGILRLADQNVLEHMVEFAKASADSHTKDIAFNMAQLAHLPLNRGDLDR